MKMEWTLVFLESLLKKTNKPTKSSFCILSIEATFVCLHVPRSTILAKSVSWNETRSTEKINKMNKYRYLNIKQTIQSYISAQKCFVVVMLL